MTDTDSQTTRTELDAIVEALHRDKRKRVRKLLRGMHVGKVASLLEALDGPQRMALWQHIDDDREEQVLKHLTPLLGAQLRREPDTSDLTDEEEEGELPDFNDLPVLIPDAGKIRFAEDIVEEFRGGGRGGRRRKGGGARGGARGGGARGGGAAAGGGR